MKHRIAFAALAAATLIAVACEDPDGGARRLATEPGVQTAGQEVQYRSTGSASVVGANHQLQSVAPAPSAPGASASVVAANGVVGTMTLNTDEPGIATSGGRRNSSFVDATKHRHTISMLYDISGGPPVAVQHFVDGDLVSTSAFAWKRTSAGWVRTRSYLQAVHAGTLYGTYATTTTPVGGGGGGGGTQPMLRLEHPGGPSTMQRMIGGAAYHLAFIFAPQDATAQSLALRPCLQQWLRYAAAAAVVTGLEIVIADAPVLTPLLITQLGAALALLGAAEDALLDCVLAHQPIPLVDNWSGTNGAGGSGSGSGTGGWDCLQGSYAAHCTTAFTL
jgi:hypothetical protein